MTKTILITGATDGIGLLTAKTLAADGHKVLLHGRSREKLEAAAHDVGGDSDTFLADFSRLEDVAKMAQDFLRRYDKLDVLINNAGVYKTPQTRTADGLDVRFVVNTFAPYLLTRQLLPIMPFDGRIVNLSSAAQAPVDIEALRGKLRLDDMSAYAQSKLAIAIWSRELAREFQDGPVFIAINPGSLLASKMVKEGFGVAGNDLLIGADILRQAALFSKFADVSGCYFDNDIGGFSEPNISAITSTQLKEVMHAIQDLSERSKRT